jgi:acyl phosphate:glycerol-3-phosphate acyltransferase
LLGDSAKGWLAVFAGAQWVTEGQELAMALAAVASILGHMYPVFHRFQGGKGVATALGILLALNPWLALATVATWITIAVFFRYSSLAAIIAAVFAAFFTLILFNPAHPFFFAATCWTARSASWVPKRKPSVTAGWPDPSADAH